MSLSNSRLAFVVLACLVALSRTHHVASVDALPSASLGAFFLLGALAPSPLSLLGLLLVTTGIDTVSVVERGVAHTCVTSAYATMPLAYACMWLAGRWLGLRHRFDVARTALVSLVLLASTLVAFLIMSGGHYFLSGTEPEPTLAGFWERGQRYYPGYLGATALYCGIALIAKSLWTRLGSAQRPSV